MTEVLLNAAAFMLIILIGIFFRKKGIVPEKAGETMRSLLINLTLPCAVAVNFSRIEAIEGSMALLMLLGLFANILMVAVGTVLFRRRSRGDRAYFMFCPPSFNIGAFGVPFVSSFLPAIGTVAACIFDVGNSLMCTGGTYAFASAYLSGGESRFSVRTFLKRLLSSPTLLTYVAMFLLKLLRLELPGVVLTLIRPIASANTFVAMLMIGLVFRLELRRDYLRDIGAVLALRHGFAVCLALFSYFVLPFELSVRQALVLTAFCPPSAVSPAYTGLCGGDQGKASAANSLSILLSVAELTALLLVMGLR